MALQEASDTPLHTLSNIGYLNTPYAYACPITPYFNTPYDTSSLIRSGVSQVALRESSDADAEKEGNESTYGEDRQEGQQGGTSGGSPTPTTTASAMVVDKEDDTTTAANAAAGDSTVAMMVDDASNNNHSNNNHSNNNHNQQEDLTATQVDGDGDDVVQEGNSASATSTAASASASATASASASASASAGTETLSSASALAAPSTTAATTAAATATTTTTKPFSRLNKAAAHKVHTLVNSLSYIFMFPLMHSLAPFIPLLVRLLILPLTPHLTPSPPFLLSLPRTTMMIYALSFTSPHALSYTLSHTTACHLLIHPYTHSHTPSLTPSRPFSPQPAKDDDDDELCLLIRLPSLTPLLLSFSYTLIPTLTPSHHLSHHIFFTSRLLSPPRTTMTMIYAFSFTSSLSHHCLSSTHNPSYPFFFSLSYSQPAKDDDDDDLCLLIHYPIPSLTPLLLINPLIPLYAYSHTPFPSPYLPPLSSACQRRR